MKKYLYHKALHCDIYLLQSLCQPFFGKPWNSQILVKPNYKLSLLLCRSMLRLQCYCLFPNIPQLVMFGCIEVQGRELENSITSCFSSNFVDFLHSKPEKFRNIFFSFQMCHSNYIFSTIFELFISLALFFLCCTKSYQSLSFFLKMVTFFQKSQNLNKLFQ